jgi:hypothetical protein
MAPHQHSLFRFASTTTTAVAITPEIARLVAADAPVAIGVSGGKDIPNPRYRPELDINLSNVNAAAVAAALGWHIVDSYLEVPIDQAIAACTDYLQRHIGRRSPELPARIIAGNPRFIDCGRREGYIEHQVHRIALMLREAKARGATHLMAA